MPSQSKAEYNTFVQGLITEASPLNFPANASLDERNFILNRDGSRERRKGMHNPNRFVYNTFMSEEEILGGSPSTFIWDSPGNFSDQILLVVQFRNVIRFFDYKAENLGSAFQGSLLLVGASTDIPYSMSAINGKLVLATGNHNIQVVTYGGGFDSFTLTEGRLKTRDVWGVEVVGGQYETDPTYRGTELTPVDAHKYNLQNQSWGIPRRRSSDGIMVDPAVQYRTDLGFVPSNSETVWLGMQIKPVETGDPPLESLFTNLFKESLGADILAPRGYYIIDALDRGASRRAQFIANKAKYPELAYSDVTLPIDQTPLDGGARVVTEFAGRVFFGGFSGAITDGDARSPSLNNVLFFSQLTKNSTDIFKCYQEGSPTSRENNDLLDTDGGFVRVDGMNRLVALVDMGASLLIIGDNGVWTLTGGSDYGFSPVNLKISNIAYIGAVGSKSVVQLEDKVMFWAADGIYLLHRQQGDAFTISNLTATTIQTLYDGISSLAKKQASGNYNVYTKKVHWVYNEAPDRLFQSDSRNVELVFDTTLSAFSRYQYYQNFAALQPFDRRYEVVGVVPPALSTNFTSIQYTRYMVTQALQNYATHAFFFAHHQAEDFRDFSFDPIARSDASAYLVTGATTASDSSTRKFVPYITTHMLRTEYGVDPTTFEPLNASSCMMRLRWEWSNGLESNKWSRQQEIYRYRMPRFVVSSSDLYNTGFELVTTKNKVRGSGRAFNIVFDSQPLKNCVIIGWNVRMVGNDV